MDPGPMMDGGGEGDRTWTPARWWMEERGLGRGVQRMETPSRVSIEVCVFHVRTRA